jgi:hypothetical protein
MPDLVLGPVLRHVDDRSATVWVETSEPCLVEVAGAIAATFQAEELRQAIDLEHWPAFRGSSARLARLIQRVGQGECDAAPATICVLSGDVHHSYSAGVSFPVGMRSALP